jgi:hypothetical protein
MHCPCSAGQAVIGHLAARRLLRLAALHLDTHIVVVTWCKMVLSPYLIEYVVPISTVVLPSTAGEHSLLA